MDLKPLFARLVGTGLGLLCAKLAAKTGIVVDDATQASIVVGAYGVAHSLSKQVFGKKKG